MRRSGRKHFQALSPPRHAAPCTWVPTCPIGAQDNILRSTRPLVDLYILLSILDPCTSTERFFSVDTGLGGSVAPLLSTAFGGFCPYGTESILEWKNVLFAHLNRTCRIGILFINAQNHIFDDR